MSTNLIGYDKPALSQQRYWFVLSDLSLFENKGM
jgi:hypothetical protein